MSEGQAGSVKTINKRKYLPGVNFAGSNSGRSSSLGISALNVIIIDFVLISFAYFSKIVDAIHE